MMSVERFFVDADNERESSAKFIRRIFSPDESSSSVHLPHQFIKPRDWSPPGTASTCTMSVLSSASANSSISWAEDAVETEFTNKLCELWNDIEKVCSTGEYANGMSQLVYQECLQWRKAFPNQNLFRFTRTQVPGEEMDTSHTSPTTTTRPLKSKIVAFRGSSHPLTPRYISPNSRAGAIKPSDYVTAWLSDCELNRPNLSSGLHRPSAKRSHEPLPPLEPNYLQMRPRATFEPKEEIRWCSQASYMTPPCQSSTENVNFGFRDDSSFSKPGVRKMDASHVEDEESDPAQCNTKQWGSTVKVQRPISSQVKGHLITPFPTGQQQLNASFRRKRSANLTLNNDRIPNSKLNPQTSPELTLPLLRVRSTVSTAAPASSFESVANGFGGHSSQSWSRYMNQEDSADSISLINGIKPFETINEDCSMDCGNNDVISNSTQLPVLTQTEATAGGQRTSSPSKNTNQPVRPFLFWLLDRVSPN